MQIILLEPIQGLGTLGDVVTVKSGYARNFLIPQQKALFASKPNLEAFEAERATREKDMKAQIATAEKESEKVTELTITLARPASETGVLYGSIKARDIADELVAKGISVERAMVQIGEPIREIGEHSVKIAFHPEVIVPLAVTVERQTS